MSCGNTCPCSNRGMDYYGVLSLKKDCDDLEIKAAFRRLAIRYNPRRTQDECLSAIFSLVAEAYDVLSDPFKRTIYDQFGEEGLKNGVPGAEGFIRPYIYHGEPMRTYREFFGTESPYADLLYVLTQSSSLLEFPEGRGIKRKEEPLIKTLYLTLLEVFLGGIKKMKIQKLVLVGDDKSRTVTKEKILTIPIKPGIPAGTRIMFPEEGDQGPTKIPADVIFITEDRPHETFRREGSDLHMTVDIFLREALTGTVVTVNTLDDRTLRIPLTSVITPDYKKHVPCEGLPLPENPKERGSLIITFNIEFPVYLPVSNKNYVKRAFDTSEDIRDTEYVHRLILANKMRRNVDFDVPVRRDRNDDEAKELEFMCNT
ncbi:DnaJ like protein subfamily B member 13 [Habropoda laboriosa]|uniref:DnaJ like protein subfamily B member 13 n=1 Tax=Habropoda laboriosa TaxID=597456 RepID=A0A0L7RF59_9HYME|nr:PREDICTED: dnaJ homolog subfamily B member 13-like [Habropoda laboriosa]KOC69454.1 DnaJ like protein subfamily B member 13 [Habropoda laboriosa]